MGFLMRAAAWTVGLLAIVVAGFVVYNAFFAPTGAVQLIADKRVCPPQVSLAAKAIAAPVDDVVGLRPGFTVADAEATLHCRDERFRFEFEPIWHTPVSEGVKSRQRMFATRAQERLALGLAGPYQHEIVYAVFHDIVYGERAVTAAPDAMIADLTRHYGAPHEVKTAKTKRELWWLYDPLGKPVMPKAVQGQNPFATFTDWVAGSLDTGRCKRQVKIDPLDQAAWSTECGLSIRAEIETRKEDPTRVARYRIVVMDQARLSAAVQAYRRQMGADSPTR